MLCAVFNYILLRILQSALHSRSRKGSDVVVSRGEVTGLGGGQPTLKLNTCIKVQRAACNPLPSVITNISILAFSQ